MMENRKQQNQEWSDTELEMMLRKTYGERLSDSESVDSYLEEAYLQLKKRKRRRNYVGRIAVAACLMLAIGLGVGVADPVVAAKIPAIGKIFSYLEQKVSYQGDYSEHAVPVEEVVQGTEYWQTDGGLSVGITEISRDDDKVYLAMKLVRENDSETEFLTEETDGTGFFYCVSSAKVTSKDGTQNLYSQENGNMPCYQIEGRFQDANTFVGIAMIELEALHAEDEVDLHFERIFQDFGNPYDGDWSFDLKMTEASPSLEVKVEQTNEQGIGINSVVRSLYEVHANLIVPEGESKGDYVVTIWDADGIPLESHGSIVENYSVYGHNVDSVTIYVLDYITYMDECKGDNVGKQPEKALFSVTVDLTE